MSTPGKVWSRQVQGWRDSSFTIRHSRFVIIADKDSHTLRAVGRGSWMSLGIVRFLAQPVRRFMKTEHA